MRRSVLIALIALAAPAAAHADIITYNGTFDVRLATPGYPLNVAGSFSFDLDTSLIPPAGGSFAIVSLTSLTVELLPGTFNAANSSAQLEFVDGGIARVYVGGDPNGPALMFPGVNDFRVEYAANGPTLGQLNYRSGDFRLAVLGQLAPAWFGSGSVAPAAVPEPASLVLGGLALPALALTRRRRQAA